MISGKDKLVGRYLEDAHFHKMVDLLYSFMMKEDVQPYEVRDAAMVAELKFYESSPVRCLLDQPIFKET